MKIIWLFLKYISLSCVLCYGSSVNNTNSSLDYYLGSDQSVESVNETGRSYEDTIETDFVKVFNISVDLRFPTPCETPNEEISYCINIENCSVLYNVKDKAKYAPYVKASRCGPANEDEAHFRVCCGKYNNFRNVSKRIDENEVLPTKCGKQEFIIRGRIYGGTKAGLKEYPWMARIIHKTTKGKKSYGCSGFLVHTKYVVTAGHCIKSPTMYIRGEPYSVVLGEYDIRTRIDCSEGNTTCADLPQKKVISSTIVHPKYQMNSTDHHNDIALIQLKSSVKLSDFVQPICLLSKGDEPIRKYYISGWGKTQQEEASPVKIKLDLPAVNRTYCQDKFKLFNLNIVDTQICAGGEKGRDSCTGDSGGPLMIRKDDGSYYAAGLVSYGIGCGMKNWPGVYTNIPSFFDWIRNEILKMGIIDRQAKLTKKLKKKQKKTQENKSNTKLI